MKLDGEKKTFLYHSPVWSNKETYAEQDGLEGLTEKESKLASYWNTPFTKICFGMTHNGDKRWLKLDYNASSLYSVFADGEYKPTALGRNAWKSLIADSSLQSSCHKEGFNVPYNEGSDAGIRIGIYADDNLNCRGSDSWIGCGFSHGVGACQHFARSQYSPDNGGRDLKTFGYILVQ
ncbi:Hypothetical predicted protein [Paramuricea clavata]|uniref:Uncharacterized protein n=1 Tax=Paramuricea clavata TaxID=317549 RepID=A0A7D9DSR8_PARCT|nr:Hypothetical predicted protein [Paramuricea clavata]